MPLVKAADEYLLVESHEYLYYTKSWPNLEKKLGHERLSKTAYLFAKKGTTKFFRIQTW